MDSTEEILAELVAALSALNFTAPPATFDAGLARLRAAHKKARAHLDECRRNRQLSYGDGG